MSLADDPILRDARTVRQLSGLSGASVLLMTKDDRHWFVRKAARAPESSQRLRRQLAKQIAFGQATDIVRTPRVLDEGEVDGRFYFDMEFVRGADGVSYLQRANYAEVVAFTDRICEYLRAASQHTVDHLDTTTLFDALYSKLCHVQRTTALIDSTTLVKLFMALERLRCLTRTLPQTLCHGDVTLENIVIDDRRDIWMLDLLDAPYEHYWQDVVKLHQDLEGGWYVRHHAPIARCVLEYIARRLVGAAQELDPTYAEVHAVLLAFTFVRILPYVRASEDQQFVAQRIEHFACVTRGENP